MGTSADHLIESSHPSEFDTQYRYHGDGVPNDHCGQLRNYAHPNADGLHEDVHTRLYRCKRWECPECWDKEFGALGQAADRVTRVLGEGMAEVLLVPSCDPGMLREAWYRKSLIDRLRKTAGAALSPPGAWVLHDHLRESPDSCPMTEHLHVFLKGLTGALPASLPGTGCQIRRTRKPELVAVLKMATRVRTSSGMRFRWVSWIGWFGRRSVRNPAETPKPIVEKVSYCEICKKEVPQKEWRVVFSPTEVLAEGWTQVRVGEVRSLRWGGEG